MGTTNEYKSTNIGGGLIGKDCDRCKKKITEYDVRENNNWDIQFDTSNDVKVEENQIKGYGYNLTIWIRDVYHEDCDDAELVKKEQESKEKEEKKDPAHFETGRYGKNADGSFELKEKKTGDYGMS